jgi:hypothetical protein
LLHGEKRSGALGSRDLPTALVFWHGMHRATPRTITLEHTKET